MSEPANSEDSGSASQLGDLAESMARAMTAIRDFEMGHYMLVLQVTEGPEGMTFTYDWYWKPLWATADQ